MVGILPSRLSRKLRRATKDTFLKMLETVTGNEKLRPPRSAA